MSFLTRMKYAAGGVVSPIDDPTVMAPFRLAEIAFKTTVATSANNELRATTQAAPDEAEETYAQVTASRRYAGSGVAGGVAGDDALLRACQMAPTDITGVASTIATYVNVAGLATLTWPATPATTMVPGVVVTISAGAGAGQRRVVTDWDAAAKKATLAAPLDVAPDGSSRYDVPAGRLYVASPAHEERIDIDVRKRNKKDAAKSTLSSLRRGMGSFQLTFAPGKAAVFGYTFRGILPALPTTSAWVEPVMPTQAATAAKLLAADVWFGGRSASKMYNLRYDHAATIDQAPDVAEALGFDEADCNEHKSAAQFSYEMAALSDDDPLRDFFAGAEKHLSVIMGDSGNGLAFAGWATNQAPDEQDQRGRVANMVNLRFAREDGWVSLFLF